jgi:hypothetical protein
MAARKRFTYARICIGVKAGVDLPETVSLHSKLGIHVQKIIYESIPFTCFLCKKAGHTAKKCPTVQEAKNRARWNRKSGEGERQEQQEEGKEESREQKDSTEGNINHEIMLIVQSSTHEMEGEESNSSGS